MTAREVVLLGSTGSIGTQALDVVRRNLETFRVVGLAAGGGDIHLLAAQALEFGVEVVGVSRASAAQDLQLAFYAVATARGYSTGDFTLPKIIAGPDAAEQVAGVARHRSGRSRAQRYDRFDRPGAHAGGPGRGPHGCSGQQGVAGRRWCAGQAGGRPGSDRAGGLRALSAGPVPAGRPSRGGPQSWC